MVHTCSGVAQGRKEASTASPVLVIIEERYKERTPATLTFMVFTSFSLYLF